MRTLPLIIFLLTLRTAKQQCSNSFGYNNGYYSGNNGNNDLSSFQQAQPTYQQTATPSPTFKWRRRALSRRVKRAKRSIVEEHDACPMDFLRNTVSEGMMGLPSHSMKKIFSFLTYMGREDLGVVCSLAPLHIESYSHSFCFQKSNSTGESCLVFEI